MKKSSKLVFAMLSCALVILGVAGCACSTEVSRESDTDFAVEDTAGFDNSTDPIYVLAVGNDSRYLTIDDTGLTPEDPSDGDTTMVLRLDPATNTISILTVPRDTAVDYNGEALKINNYHRYTGIEGYKSKVGELLGVDIDYYVDMKFIDFVNFVDAYGGFGIDVPMSLTGGDIINGGDISLEAGENTLDGAASLMLARQRKLYATQGEAIRQMISRQMVANAIQTVASKPSSEAASYANLLESYGETNFPEATLQAYIEAFMNNEGSITFYLGTAPYDGDIDDSGTWRIPYDADAYATLREEMENEVDLDVVALPEVA